MVSLCYHFFKRPLREQMDRVQKVKITNLNPHMICVLCGGYFIDATTIIECLHSFCRTCILRYLESSKSCPICDVMVHKTRPLENIRSDKTLQDLVYKLVPSLYKNEMKRRRDFYILHASDKPSTPSEDRGDEFCDRIIYTEDEKISLSLELCSLGIPSTYPSKIRRPSGPEIKKTSDIRYLLCPAAFTVGHLKKFLNLKFDFDKQHQIDIFHTDEPLHSYYTLMDIAYIYTWTRRGPLRLYYTVYDKRPKKRKYVKANSLMKMVKHPAYGEKADEQDYRKAETLGPVQIKKLKKVHTDDDATKEEDRFVKVNMNCAVKEQKEDDIVKTDDRGIFPKLNEINSVSKPKISSQVGVQGQNEEDIGDIYQLDDLKTVSDKDVHFISSDMCIVPFQALDLSKKENAQKSTNDNVILQNDSSVPKRKRGRPRKDPSEKSNKAGSVSKKNSPLKQRKTAKDLMKFTKFSGVRFSATGTNLKNCVGGKGDSERDEEKLNGTVSVGRIFKTKLIRKPGPKQKNVDGQSKAGEIDTKVNVVTIAEVKEVKQNGQNGSAKDSNGNMQTDST
ncbi:hypothetical protein CHS0354_019859 [Potamilus streckersoni]|uniref:RING-type domain-containing protein n=1 Tax=Potamilus streckersoni TaxID=2493646 RepID=A0AAE0S419_9BIVA|nr:hypothetical protein CHS0354_019859 [Potamilus streckersoni]